MVDVLSPETVHVLLVDDERLSRVVVANLLRKCNYKGVSLCAHATSHSMFTQQLVEPSRQERAARWSIHHPRQLRENFTLPCTVTVAESGTEALEALQQQAVGTFQLVLTVSQLVHPHHKAVHILLLDAEEEVHVDEGCTEQI
eukprot:1153223-Pelagomonas_calceolata.AAC.3